MRHALTTLLIALVASSMAHAADFNTWGQRMEITFPGYPSGNDDLSNFPALVILTDGSNGVDFSDFENGGDDLRFTTADQSTELSYEIDTWDDANSNSYVWVQVPLLENNATIYAYWGKSGETAPTYTTNGSTWSAGYAGVWHLSEDPSGSAPQFRDSSTNLNHAMADGLAADDQVAGIVAGSVRVDGDGDSVKSSSFTYSFGTEITLSIWYKQTGGGIGSPRVLEVSKLGNADSHCLAVDPDGSNRAWLQQASGTRIASVDDANAYPFSEWRYMAYTYGSPTATLYMAGKETASETESTTDLDDGSYFVAGAISDGSGVYTPSDHEFDGVLDELRISTVARSSNWVWATYMNMASNHQFTAYADAVSPDPDLSRITTQPVTNVTTTSACLNGALSSTGTSATAAFVYWGETDVGTNATQWANTNVFAAPQSVGPLTHNVTLQTGKEYFYRYAASNDSGRVWADSSEYLLTAGITVSANPDAISENGESASFSFARGPSLTNRAVTVYYAIGGDAVNGTDYESLTETTVVIAAGDTNATVQVTSILDYHFNSDEALELTVLGGHNYAVGTPSNAVLTITNEVLPDLTIDSATNGYWDAGTTWVGGVVPSGADHVVITNGCTVTIRDNTSLIVQSLTIETNGVLTHTANSTTLLGERYKVVLDIANDLTINLGGKIDVTGMGYSGDNGPGKAGYSSGGGYGGVGGYHNAAPNPGTTYGSVTAPTNCGSGGDWGPGGGAVILRVAGQTALHGDILARWASNNYPGSGGSIFLTTGTLTGDGSVDVGGYSSQVAGAGAGRIAVILTGGNDFGSVSLLAASASVGSHKAGSPGTLYTQTLDQGPNNGTLTIDARGVVAGALSTTLINDQVTDTGVGSVIVTNAARVTLTNQILSVHGDWKNTASFVGMDGSTVIFAGTNTATVTGHNTFHNLICTNAGKSLSFEDGKTNTVNGTLTLADVILDSSSGSASWFLEASANMHSVSNVTAGRSDARSGASISAFDSTDDGGNFNWVFADSGFATNTWTGTTDRDWSKAGNWLLNRTTAFTDSVIIPDSCLNYPLLDFEKQILSLVISNGASLSLNGYPLTVDEDVTVAGTLTATGSEMLTLGGDLDFSGGGIFDSATSPVLLAGTGPQTVVLAGNAFHALTVDNNGSTVTFTDATVADEIVNLGSPVTFSSTLDASSLHNESGTLEFSGVVTAVTFTNQYGDLTFHDDVSAQSFTCLPGDMDLTFEAGKTFTVGDLTLYGHYGAPIRLRSSVDSSAWNLSMTNVAKIHHVDVRDSDATTGKTIRPAASTNSGNNVNWDFSAAWQTWQGTASTEFTNAANWTPAVVPNENTYLLIEGDYLRAPIMSGVATAAQMIVGGYTTATVTVNGHLTTLDDMEILPDATLTHSANNTTEANKLYLTVGGDLMLQGAINVDGKGFAGRRGPGAGGGNSGGGYGGVGGYHLSYPAPGGVYGSITAPTNCGSGGGSGSGGGAVILNVRGTTTITGDVLARDNQSINDYKGSGGGVFITTGTLAGNGMISVAAKNGGYGPGGGGRISVVLTNGNDLGNVQMTATAGTGNTSGSAGTIYTQTLDQGPNKGTLLIDAKGVVAGALSTTLINGKVTGAVVGTVILKNEAILSIATNQLLTVYGSWSNAATFVAGSNSTVNFIGPALATIEADNTFYNLTAGAAGKTILFEAGKTNTVNGTLTFMDDTTLLSKQDGTQWWLDLSTATGSHIIGGVTVKDSNASPGPEILAGTGSTDLKNNVNWSFPAKGSVFIVR